MSNAYSYELVVRNSAESVITPLKGGIHALDRVYDALVAAGVDPITGHCSNYISIRQYIVRALQSLQNSDQAATTSLKRLDETVETLTRDKGMLEREKNATDCTLSNLKTEQASNEKLLQVSQGALGEAQSNLSSARETLREQERREENAKVTAIVGIGVSAIPFVGWVVGPALVIGSVIELNEARDAMKIAERELGNVKYQVAKYQNKVSDQKSKISQTLRNISQTDQKLTRIRDDIYQINRQRGSLSELQRKLRRVVHTLTVLMGRVNVLEQHTRHFILQETVLEVMGEVMNAAEEITSNELLCNYEMLRLVWKMKSKEQNLRAICASRTRATTSTFLGDYI